MKLWMNDWGVLGYFSYKNCGCIPKIIGCEYPENSNVDHLGIGAIWLGALVDTSRTMSGLYRKYVTGTDDAAGQVVGSRGEGIISEMSPSDPANPWNMASILNVSDSDAVSESDYCTSYVDTTLVPGLLFHSPLGIKVIQKSYAWIKTVRAPIIVVEYNFINLGIRKLENVYLGFDFNANVEVFDTNSVSPPNLEGYWAQLRTAHVNNPIDLQTTPIGVTLLDIPHQVNVSQLRFRWMDNEDNSLFPCALGFENCDAILYDYLSGAAFPQEGSIRPDSPTIVPGYELLFSLYLN